MMNARVYILGGYQTDFAVNWRRAGQGIYDILKAAVEDARTFGTLNIGGGATTIVNFIVGVN